jgi:transposase
MRELSVTEQRYQAVLAVISDGATVSRKTVHQWLSRYEVDGLEGLKDRSHRPRSSPLQMPAVVEVALVDLRRRHP